MSIDIPTQIDTGTSTKHMRMLAPVAYSDTALPALRLARSSRFARRVGKTLLALLLASFVVVGLAPWQQSVKGTGDVIAYDPFERQQALESPIEGRVVQLGENGKLVENVHVKKGELIAVVADIDSEYLARLELQLGAAQNQVEAQEALLKADGESLKLAKTVVDSFESQLATYKQVKEWAVSAAQAAVESSRNKVDSAKQQLAQHRATLKQVDADYHRQKTLYEEQIVSQLKFQDAERKLREVEAKVKKAEADVRAAMNLVTQKESDRKAKEQEAQAKIDYAEAMLGKSNTDVTKAEGAVAKARSELAKAKKALPEIEAKVARQRNQRIVAPFDGFITQITPNNGSQVLKKGDPICVIVPDTADRAVQVWLDGNDAPLVEPGRHVRLQFEGWPAVQFAGWPSVAVGTFGGEVVSVDATDDGKGKFRVLVRPDKNDASWPNERFLRQGVRANGWLLLEEVPLWYEIWRNMNGFPPVVSTTEPKDSSKPKLPKL